jgi:tRNA dimethylallyltransferase
MDLGLGGGRILVRLAGSRRPAEPVTALRSSGRGGSVRARGGVRVRRAGGRVLPCVAHLVDVPGGAGAETAGPSPWQTRPVPHDPADAPATPRVVAVVGPTAAGKTDLSLDLAERLGGEVVNTDAMQVYRGMDIGTAKVPPGERRGIRHHLLDVLDVREQATVAEFQAMARSVVVDCLSRGVTPVLVGGSALYTRAVLDRFEFPGTDPELRARLEADLAAVGPAALHARLRERDPEAAGHILPGNSRRVVRALEVIALTGRPFTATLPERSYFFADSVQIGVRIPRPVLDRRIEQRVRRMWEAGFVDEVRRLADQGLREGRTANRALGYQQVLEHLDGRLTEQEALDRTVTGTRRFARRQASWFDKDPRITWVDWDDSDSVERALDACRVGSPD